jgi:hypothetical protein
MLKNVVLDTTVHYTTLETGDCDCCVLSEHDVSVGSATSVDPCGNKG